MIHIYAGDHYQAECLAGMLGLKRKDWWYVNEYNIDGMLRGTTVLLWGTHYRRPDYSRTVDAMLAVGANILSVSDEVMRDACCR